MTRLTTSRSGLVAVGVAAATALALTSCSTETKEKAESAVSSAKTASSSMSSAMSSAASSAMSPTSSASASAAPAGLVGAGCAGYAEKVPTGPGSVEGLAKDPVATAAGNSPVLTTLASALSGKLNPEVNLVETLNNGEYTVFAPTDDAFAKLPAATVDKLKTDSALLTSILTYHVVSGQAGPSAVVGDHKTVQGESVTVTGSGDSLKVNDAGVVCGGIKTANATLYLIDTVLTPPAAPASGTSSAPATSPTP